MKELMQGADIVIDCVGMDGKKNVYGKIGQNMQLLLDQVASGQFDPTDIITSIEAP